MHCEEQHAIARHGPTEESTVRPPSWTLHPFHTVFDLLSLPLLLRPETKLVLRRLFVKEDYCVRKKVLLSPVSGGGNVERKHN